MDHSIRIQLIEANLEELLALKAEANEWPMSLGFYYLALMAHLKKNQSQLQEISDRAKKHYRLIKESDEPPEDRDDFLAIVYLIQLRLSLHSITTIVAPDFEPRLGINDEEVPVPLEDPLWLAEEAFIFALIYGARHDYENELKNFLKASLYYKRAGAKVKSILAQQNAIASEASLRPNQRFTVEYHQLMNQAILQKVDSTAGLCALNISRDYQLLGAKLAALDMATKAIHFLERDFGTSHFGLALCHRAQLYFELGRKWEAHLDLEKTVSIASPEVETARKIVHRLLEGMPPRSLTEDPSTKTVTMAPAWSNRFEECEYSCSFGPSEERLIKVIANKSMDRSELLELLFPDELIALDYETVLNRFKNLLARIRKKAPNLILHLDGKYAISPTKAAWLGIRESQT